MQQIFFEVIYAIKQENDSITMLHHGFYEDEILATSIADSLRERLFTLQDCPFSVLVVRHEFVL